MSKGGDTPSGNTTTTTVNSPWSGQQPYLTQGFQAAQNLFNQGGPNYYPGQTYAGPTDLQLTGIENEANLGLNGTQAQAGANNTLSSILNPNWLSANPANGLYGSLANGGMQIDTGGYYTPVASGAGSNPLTGHAADALNSAASGQIANTAGIAPISAIANGSGSNVAGMDTLAHIASGANLSADNPYFKQMADTIRANVLPGIQANFAGGGRLDSGLASRAAAEGLGDSIGNLAYQNYQQGLQQQQSAADQLAGLGQNATQQQLGAAGMLSNIGAGDIAARLGAANSLGQFGQNSIGNQLAGANALTNLGFGNVANRIAGGQGLSQDFSTAASNQLGALGMAPSIGNLDYQQAAALQDAGQTTQGLNQAAIADAMARWNYGQQQPYANLQNYMQNIMGNYGGTSSTTQPYFQNGLANALNTGLGAFTLGNALTGGQLSSGLGNIFGNLFGSSTPANDALGNFFSQGIF